MDRIFSEIKKAIEEEMRNAESGSAPPQRQQGGRRAQEYAEWLKDEQERLRGSQQTEPLEQVPVEVPDDWQRQQQERREAADRRHEEQRRQRSADGAQRGGARSSTQYRRSEARHQRRTADAYATRQSTGAETRRRIQQLMGTRQGLRQAFLLREIVSKPVSLREPDDHLIT